MVWILGGDDGGFLKEGVKTYLIRSTNFTTYSWQIFSVFTYIPPIHLSLDSAPDLGTLISRWEINKFENCWYKSVRILEVLKLLFQQILNLSSSHRNMSGPVLRALSNNRWLRGSLWARVCSRTFLKLTGNPYFQSNMQLELVPRYNQPEGW
jgi:hypothetical protein